MIVPAAVPKGTNQIPPVYAVPTAAPLPPIQNPEPSTDAVPRGLPSPNMTSVLLGALMKLSTVEVSTLPEASTRAFTRSNVVEFVGAAERPVEPGGTA